MTTDNDKPRNGPYTVRVVARKRSVAHPRSSLKQAEEFARLIYKEGARRCDQDNIAKKAGYTGTNNSSYATLKATAQQFGMVTADNQTISVSEEWINLFLHDDRQQLQLARAKAMQQPDLYKQLIEDFGNRQLPPVERLAQQLHINSKYNILKDAASVAAKTFYDSASYAGMLDGLGFLKTGNSTVVNAAQPEVREKEPISDPMREPIREVDPGRAEQARDKNAPPPPPLDQADVVLLPIQLENDQMMYIYGPRRLLRTDKERIKQYIDLWLEERATGNPSNSTNDASNIDN